MLILMIFFGWLGGWLLTLLSDYLVRFATADVKAPAINRPPAVMIHAAGRTDFRWHRLHLVVEIITPLYLAVLWVTSTLTVGLALAFAYFTLIAVMDIKYRVVLNVLTYPALLIVVAAHLTMQAELPPVFVGGGFAFMIFFATAVVRPGDLGGGDIKLVTVIGLMLGFPQVLWALIVGAGLGAIVAVGLLVIRRPSSKMYMPYAPFLCFGALVALHYSPLIGS
jgi:prepilin signal peptidase PulO-like enzyme (type II secretory pathway)